MVPGKKPWRQRQSHWGGCYTPFWSDYFILLWSCPVVNADVSMAGVARYLTFCYLCWMLVDEVWTRRDIPGSVDFWSIIHEILLAKWSICKNQQSRTCSLCWFCLHVDCIHLNRLDSGSVLSVQWHLTMVCRNSVTGLAIGLIHDHVQSSAGLED